MIDTVVRTAVLYIVVVLLIRLMGKRQVGELQPSELVVTILISELASIPMQDLSRPVSNGVTAILVLVILELLLSVITLKIPPMRRLFSGKPAIVIADGKIDQQMMKRLRYSIDDLLEGLRTDGCFCIEDVHYAILETNGTLSVMLKKSADTPTRSEMGINHMDCGLPITIISDGKLQKPAIKSHNVDMNAVYARLKAERLTVKDVFLMTGEGGGDYVIIKKEGKI